MNRNFLAGVIIGLYLGYLWKAHVIESAITYPTETGGFPVTEYLNQWGYLN